MDEFLDEMDDEQVDDLLQPEEGEDKAPQLYEHFRFVADRGQSLLRVDKFLVDRMFGATRNRIQSAADAGCIMANGKPVKSNYRVKPEDVVTIMMTRPPRTFEILPENIPIKIVYEDDDLLVVDKPAGLVVHPGHGNYTGTLVNALAWYLKDDPTYDPNDPALGLVHRIDKDTSGLLVVAKKPEAKAHLSMQFFHKTTKREYRALVWGIVREDEGRIEGNIGRNPRDRMQMTVFPEGDQGKTAVTHYSVLERLGYVTLVKCRLETGRTHQIRVHMKYIGHTLFNDERYGGNEILKGTTSSKYKQFVDNCFAICPRQALHAKTLGFVHPTTGEEMFFDSEIPADMTALIDKWRVYFLTFLILAEVMSSFSGIKLLAIVLFSSAADCLLPNKDLKAPAASVASPMLSAAATSRRFWILASTSAIKASLLAFSSASRLSNCSCRKRIVSLLEIILVSSSSLREGSSAIIC